MVPQFEYSTDWLWIIFLGMAVIIPFVVVFFDDDKVHNK
jgi:formate-dependent nitrite reductase membrane component NrfD